MSSSHLYLERECVNSAVLRDRDHDEPLATLISEDDDGEGFDELLETLNRALDGLDAS